MRILKVSIIIYKHLTQPWKEAIYDGVEMDHESLDIASFRVELDHDSRHTLVCHRDTGSVHHPCQPQTRRSHSLALVDLSGTHPWRDPVSTFGQPQAFQLAPRTATADEPAHQRVCGGSRANTVVGSHC